MRSIPHIKKSLIYVGRFVADDATGNSVLLKQQILVSKGIKSLICCGRHQTNRPDVRQVDGLGSSISMLPHFLGSDLHLFEFGFGYDLFRLIQKVPAKAYKAVYFHGLTPHHLIPEAEKAGIDHAYQQILLADHAHVIFHSTDYSRHLLNSYGITKPEFAKLPLPVDLPTLPKKPFETGTTKLLHVGRMVASKGLLELLEALDYLARGGFTDWTLEVIHNPETADARYQQEVETFIQEAGMSQKVKWLGVVSSRLQMAELYSNADITLIPSHHETYCLPLIESFWCGTPVIAYASGAIPEVAEGHASLVEPRNIKELANAILHVSSKRPEIPTDRYGLLSREEFHKNCRVLLSDRDTTTFRCRFTHWLDRLPELSARYLTGR